MSEPGDTYQRSADTISATQIVISYQLLTRLWCPTTAQAQQAQAKNDPPVGQIQVNFKKELKGQLLLLLLDLFQ